MADVMSVSLSEVFLDGLPVIFIFAKRVPAARSISKTGYALGYGLNRT